MNSLFLHLLKVLCFFLTSTLDIQFLPTNTSAKSSNFSKNQTHLIEEKKTKITSKIKRENSRKNKVQERKEKQKDKIQTKIKPVILEIPKHCRVLKDKTCLLQLIKGKRLIWSKDALSITLMEKSVLFLNKNTLHLLEGVFFIHFHQKNQNFILKTSHGSIKVSKGRAFFQVNQEKTLAINISSSSLNLKHSGEKSSLFLPKGYQVWISEFASSSKKITPLIGIPRPAKLKWLLSYWTHANQLPKKEFKKEVHLFQKHWKMAIEDSSLWYKYISKNSMKK